MKYAFIVGALLAAVLMYYQDCRITQLKTDCELLTVNLNKANDTLSFLEKRSKDIEEATLRLSERDRDNQDKLRDFEHEMASLSATNEEIRAALDTRLPDDIVCRLRSYRKSTGGNQ